MCVYHWPEEDDLALVFQQTEEFQRIGFGRPPFVTARTLPKTGHHHVIHPEETHAGTRAQQNKKNFSLRPTKSQKKIRVRKKNQLNRVGNQAIGSRIIFFKNPLSPSSLSIGKDKTHTRRDGERERVVSSRATRTTHTHQKKQESEIIIIVFLFPTIRKSTANFTLAVTHAARTERQDKTLESSHRRRRLLGPAVGV
jgi:hypothetical protein